MRFYKRQQPTRTNNLPPTPRTRLAPSPTGALHLGNARTFLVNWALARRLGWHIVLRIEDLDGPRIKPGSAEALVDTMRWLGLDWDSGPFVQSHDLEPYRAAAHRLIAGGFAYRSDLSRTDILAAASAPQAGAHEARFPAELRPGDALSPGRWGDQPDLAGATWRFASPEGGGGDVEFEDGFVGPTVVNPAADVGDFIIWTRANVPAYQLAVIVDDHRQGITHVVRGDDLLTSAARQILLARALNLHPIPQYTHLPLVVGPDGRRLAKRHGDTRVETYRRAGVPPEAIIAMIARLSGMLPREGPGGEMSATEFAAGLALNTIPRSPAVFTEEDHRWLLSRAR